MIPLTLPPSSRRILLRSFWLIVSFIFGAGVWLIGWLLGISISWLFGVIALLGLGLIVFVNEPFARRLYYAWNNRIAAPLSRIASAAVTRICFFVVFVATAKAGSRVGTVAKVGTQWKQRHTLSRRAYDLPYSAEGKSSEGNRWISSYVQWAFRSKNVWALSLIPFLCFLRMLSPSEGSSVEANIYTLF